MKATTQQLATWEASLREEVEYMAKNAAAWMFDGNTDDATYRCVLTGLDDGDPEILDSLPILDWSGQWADGPSWENTVADAMPDGVEIDDDEDLEYDALADDWFASIGQDYAGEIIEHEVERTARLQLD